MEPIKCSHPACGRFTFEGPKCARHTFEVAEIVADATHSMRRVPLLLNAEAARGIPAAFGGSVRVSPRWSGSKRPRNTRRVPANGSARTPREASPVALIGNADSYAARLALVGATGDQNH